jgi:transposase InsO family protein
VYHTRDKASADIFDYIEVFYNRARRHSHLNGMSPEAFEDVWRKQGLVSTIVWEVQIMVFKY